MDLAARACFAPDAAMSTFAKLGAAEKKMGVSIPRFLRTHPLSEARPSSRPCPARSAAGLPLAWLRASHACPLAFPSSPPCEEAAAVHLRACPAGLTSSACMQERIQALMRHLPKAREWAEIEGCSVALAGFDSELMPFLVDPVPRQAVRHGRPAAAGRTPASDDPFGF